MTTEPYTPPRDRDAQASIRGYVYQVDTTLLRWIELDDSGRLEPECGEDIDQVRDSLDDPVRLLEQVKLREANLTIRTPAAVECLANAVEHLQGNPGQKLLFRFTTNAVPTLEQPPRVSNSREPAIVVWEKIRSGEIAGNAADDCRAKLQSILRACKQPSGVPDPVWIAFQTFIRETENLSDLIPRFEWLHSCASSQSVSDEVVAALAKRTEIQGEIEARKAYEHLFLHVFKLLCEPRPRILTSHTLKEAIAGSLTPEDDRLLTLLKARVLEGRVSALEVGQAALGARLSAVETGAIVATTRSRLRRTEKPLPQAVTQRPDAIRAITEEAGRACWIAIDGPVGAGKSTLARLLADSLGGVTAWLRLSGTDDANNEPLLAAGLDELAGTKSGKDGALGALAARAIGSGVLLLDDLPRLSGGEPLADLLTELASALPAGQVSLVSTSCYALPASLMSGGVYCQSAPPFVDAEVASLFAGFGAPDNLMTEARCSLVNSLCHGHAGLLEAAARFLKGRNWTWDEEVLRGLLDGLHAEGVNRDTTTRLIKSVGDVDTRELAHRLRLVTGDATGRDVDALARVPQPIGAPRARISELEGMWLVPAGGAVWFVSPLLRALPDDVLSEDTLTACHLALAENLLDASVVDVVDIRRALLHLRAASDMSRLAAVLAKAYAEITRAEPAPGPIKFAVSLEMFTLPDDLELTTRIHVASLRHTALAHLGMPGADDVDELYELVEQAGPLEGLAVYAACATTAFRLARSDDALAIRFLAKALEAERNGPIDASAVGLDQPLPALAPVLWMLTEGLSRNSGSYASWFAAVRSLDDSQRQALDSDDFALGTAYMFGTTFWSRESERPEKDRDWEGVLARLRTLESDAGAVDLAALSASAVRSQVVVIGEYQEQALTAIELGEEKLRFATHSESRFLIAETVGRLQVWSERLEDARRVLDVAVDSCSRFDGHGIYSLRAQTLRYHAEAWIAEDGEKALESAQAAVREAQSSLSVPDAELVRAHAEHAMVLWVMGRRGEAYMPLALAARRALMMPSDQEAKGLIAQLAHIASFMTSEFVRGLGPKETADGSEYAPPRVGFFRAHIDVDSAYRDELRTAIAAYLCLYAHGVHDSDDATAWAKRAVEEAHASDGPAAFAPLATCANAYLLRDGQVEDVFEAAYRMGSASKALMPEEMTVSLGDWSYEERTVSWFGLIPAVLAVCMHATRDQQQGEVLLRRLQQACRDVGGKIDKVERWEHIASMLGGCYGDEPLNDVVRRINNFTGSDDHHLIGTACVLLTTFHPKPSLQWIARTHVRALSFLLDWVGKEPAVTDILLGPFVTEFWSRQVEERAFSMASPRVLRLALSDTNREETVRPRIRAILEGVSAALRVSQK